MELPHKTDCLLKRMVRLAYTGLVMMVYTLHTQVGDSAEVMYFAATSDRNREEWMEAFRKGG